MKKTSSALSILLALLMILSMTSVAASGGLTLESAKIGDTLLQEAETIRTNDEITLTFSGKVTDSSVLANNIQKIQVKDNGGNTFGTVSPSGNKKFIVALSGISQGDYTLTIGKDFADVDGNTLGKKVEIPFTVNKGDGSGSGNGQGGGNNPLELVSVKAGDADLEGAEIDGDASITVTFSRGMTDYQDDNFANITVYDETGAKVEGVTYSDFTKDASGNSYTTLSLPSLAPGNYTLKLGKNLKANNGNTLGKAVTISFTVKAAAQPDEPGSGSDDNSPLSRIVDIFMKIIKYIVNIFKKLVK